jgi:hypothetical protein
MNKLQSQHIIFYMTTLLINGIDISQLVSSPFKIFVYNVLNVEYTRKNLNNFIQNTLF